MITEGLPHPSPRNADEEADGFVQIEGDVKYPGVYGFNGKAELKTLIGNAGGLQPSPQIPITEMASRIFSGDRIVVRYEKGTCSFHKQEMASFYKITLGIPVLLNEESEAGLTAIPGIGPRLAGNIVNMRHQKGGFKSLDELLTIKGIGWRLYHKIKSFLKIKTEKPDHED
ncbi:MAG: helix-hairpin-helix domain-containing protein [Deltaproteobacteria bacterium]|nr:helix-hairpin-helix domain-containing protein [Deltaproteobacteria bacterium]